MGEGSQVVKFYFKKKTTENKDLYKNPVTRYIVRILSFL